MSVSTCFVIVFCSLKCLTNLVMVIVQQMQKLIKMTLRVSVSTSFFLYCIFHLLPSVASQHIFFSYICVIYLYHFKISVKGKKRKSQPGTEVTNSLTS